MDTGLSLGIPVLVGELLGSHHQEAELPVEVEDLVVSIQFLIGDNDQSSAACEGFSPSADWRRSDAASTRLYSTRRPPNARRPAASASYSTCTLSGSRQVASATA